MSGIKSPLSNQSFGPKPKLREFNVPDESQGGTEEDPRFYQSSQDVSEIDFKQAEALMASRGIQFDSQRLQSEYNARQASKRQMSNQELAELEQEIKASKQLKASGGKEPLSQSARKRIELLTGSSRLTKEVNLDDNIYVLRTLKSKELRAIMVECYNCTQVEFPYELRRQILAHSITSVAGTDLELFLGSSDLAVKLDFFDELDDLLQQRLYSEYLDLKKEAEEKYGLNSPNLSQEVVDDLKK